jgi:mannitol 2-dehydrogenase
VSAIPLRAATIDDLAPRVAVPGYDRASLQIGIVHFGAGAFHRAHQAMYLDRLMSEGQARDWAVCAVDVLETDRPKRATFRSQDGLYTLVVKHPDGTLAPRVIGSLAEYLFAPDEPGAVLGRLADPRIRIVSLTITEGGYNLRHATSEFDAVSPAVQHDLKPGAVPRTVFGFIVAALRRRRDSGVPPFTVMSCDNIEGNGNVARSVLGAFADLAEPGLGDWLRGAVAFPNSMVDRITPVTTATDISRLADEFGVTDAWPVVCEPYAQWVLEDDFPAGRPRWQDCGVQLVTDVRPYEQMKLRLLNGGHLALAYPAALAGYRYVHEAAADPVIAAFVTDYLQFEARPTVPAVPGVDLDDYVTKLLARFRNPAMADTVARLCAGASDKVPKWVLPVVRQNLAAGRPVTLGAALIASWARYAEGIDDAGQPIDVADSLHADIGSRARRQRTDRLSFVANERIFGDLGRQPDFTEPYATALDSFHRLSARQTLAQISASRQP